MDARDDHVEPGKQFHVLVERPVLQDVDLDAGQDAKRRQFPVQRCDHFQLAAEPIGIEPTRDREAGTVIGEGEIVVPEADGCLGHLGDGAAAIGPVRVAVAVATQLGPEPGGTRVERRGPDHLQFGQVAGRLSLNGLRDHVRGRFADVGDLPEAP